MERDGADVTAEFAPRIVGNYSDVLTLVDRAQQEDRRQLAGEYVVTLTLGERFERDLGYRLHVYADDERLEVDSKLSAPVVPVNGTVDVSVQLYWLNVPIEDATVSVRAFGPDTDMGEALSEGNAVEVSDDDTNAGIQKYNQLAANDPAFLEKLKLSPNAIAMTHQGGGRYTGSYAVPDNVGVVHFVYDVSADSPLYGPVQRHWYESAYARYDSVDLSQSNLSSALVDGVLTLSFTPRRPSGKLIGPGQGNSFVFDGVPVQEARDLQNGTYEFDLAGSDPDAPIKVVLLADEIYSGPAGWGDLDDQDKTIIDVFKDLPLWIWILVILLLILVIAFGLIRRRPATP